MTRVIRLSSHDLERLEKLTTVTHLSAKETIRLCLQNMQLLIDALEPGGTIVYRDRTGRQYIWQLPVKKVSQ